MSQFNDLIHQWRDLMCQEEDAASLEDKGISFVQEDRVLKLTAQYIDQLKSIQGDIDAAATIIAERVSPILNVSDSAALVKMSERFLSNVGGSLRNEIPKELPRSERRKARQFVIDWADGNDQAGWPELDVFFPLAESLVFCAEQYAGADEATSEALAQQLISALHDEEVMIPRLTLVSGGASKSVFAWENATVPIHEPEGDQPEMDRVLVLSPILSYFQDRVQESKIRIEQQLASAEEFDDPHVQVAAVIDKEMDLDDTPTRIQEYLERVAAYSGGDRRRALSAISSTAYWETFEAIVCEDKATVDQRVRVVKSCNAIREEELVH